MSAVERERGWSERECFAVSEVLHAWHQSQGLHHCVMEHLAPWTEYPVPDYNTAFLTATNRLLLFHLTPAANVAAILDEGFKDSTCRIGFDGRPSVHGVHVGLVPPLPGAIDTSDPRLMKADDAGWLVIEGPANAIELAISRDQDTSWPLFQLAFSASLINQWPRRQLAVPDVLGYRPALLVNDGGQYVEESIADGWLPAALLERFHR
jgi:hypothetical protein